MKVTNLRNRSLRIGDRTINSKETISMADEDLVKIQSLLDEGFIKIEKVKITEKKEG